MIAKAIQLILICWFTSLGNSATKPAQTRSHAADTDAAEAQAASIGILASQIACKKSPNCHTSRNAGSSTSSSNLSSPSSQHAPAKTLIQDIAVSQKISTKSASASSNGEERASRNDVTGDNNEECGDEDRADCFDQCYPPGTDGPRKHMLYCSYCCLSCRCDPKDENNPDASIPADVVQALRRDGMR